MHKGRSKKSYLPFEGGGRVSSAFKSKRKNMKRRSGKVVPAPNGKSLNFSFFWYSFAESTYAFCKTGTFFDNLNTSTSDSVEVSAQ